MFPEKFHAYQGNYCSRLFFPDVIFMVLFCVFWYFNYSVLLSLAGLIGPSASMADIIPGVQGQGIKVT